MLVLARPAANCACIVFQQEIVQTLFTKDVAAALDGHKRVSVCKRGTATGADELGLKKVIVTLLR